jgi:hypothetical protein
MGPQVVYLHVGSTKTGTTFVQRALWDNQRRLRADGVTLAARHQRFHVRAVRAMQTWQPEAGTALPPAWLALANRVRRSSASSAIVSQEFLSWLSADQARAVVDSLEAPSVKVVLTARDLARVVPAQWASSIRQRQTWTLTDYAAAVQHGPGERKGGSASDHFWRRMDYPAIVATWAAVVGPAHVTVVTVPPAGSDADELWRRFCGSCALDAAAYATPAPSNVSLGAATSELLRRFNGLPAVQAMSRQEYADLVTAILIRRVVDVSDKPDIPAMLPEAQRPWVVDKSAETVAELESSKVRVVGSLADLRPQPATTPYVAPEDLPVEGMLEIALDALSGLVLEHGRELSARRFSAAEQRSRFDRLHDALRRSLASR